MASQQAIVVSAIDPDIFDSALISYEIQFHTFLTLDILCLVWIHDGGFKMLNTRL